MNHLVRHYQNPDTLRIWIYEAAVLVLIIIVTLCIIFLPTNVSNKDIQVLEGLQTQDTIERSSYGKD